MDKLEPLTLSIGDTLAFCRYLDCYLPSSGWQLQYQIRGGANATDGQLNTAFVSTPDSTNTTHIIKVPEATTALWAAGEFILAGYAVNANLSKRDEIYQNTIILTPNFNTGQDNVPTQTHAQKMICLLESSLLSLAASSLQATTVQQTEIIRVKRADLDKQLGFYREKRANEIAIENVRNGRPSGQNVIPQMNLVAPWCVRGAFGTWPFPQ